MLTLSVAIIAYNEERIIGRTIASVKTFANEIIVVDSGSSDNTIKIAQENGAICYTQDWLGYAAQKNFCLDKTTSDLILSLDADEIVTENLAKEIKIILENKNLNDIYDGYTIPRLLYIANQPLRYGGFYPDRQLRLIKKNKGHFNNRPVHESIEITGTIGACSNHLQHYAYDCLVDFEQNHDKYAKLSAQYFKDKFYQKHSSFNFYYKTIYWINLQIHPLWTFIYRFIIRRGFLDGLNGLKANIAYSIYVRKKIFYLIQTIKTSQNIYKNNRERL